MFSKKKCSGCAKKLESNFNFCPYCGTSIKEKKENQNYGLLGRHDSTEPIQPETKLPFGMDKMLNGLIKQLEEQMNNGQFDPNTLPKGFNIKVSTGKPKIQQHKQTQTTKRQPIQLSQEEKKRRINLPKVNATSKIKRLGDKIIYEIEAPGVTEKEDISITKLEKGLEIRVYTKNKCYIKTIPLQADISQCYIKNKKVYLELKAE